MRTLIDFKIRETTNEIMLDFIVQRDTSRLELRDYTVDIGSNYPHIHSSYDDGSKVDIYLKIGDITELSLEEKDTDEVENTVYFSSVTRRFEASEELQERLKRELSKYIEF